MKSKISIPPAWVPVICRSAYLLQLQRKLPTHSTKLAMQILTEYFEEFSRKHYDKILNKLNISEDELRSAIDEIVPSILNREMPGAIHSRSR